MGFGITEENLVAYEPVPVADTFVTGMLPVEDLGGLFRITLFSDRRDAAGGTERMIVSRLLMSRQTLESWSLAVFKALGEAEQRAGLAQH
ncbi:hypothetical protein OSH11_13775 [Kaistia dalseonensis]|uniref:Uncharacterized protein n=1 Tax=Kaistia dalseonensis TaxID=410840 RepID=A0ABU0H7U3_9HYPH|nr:hypothetical protein [Kaistia dalseonensis]MCX5495778.1 hypothetical protein [Kaistia dalseonensis]MDQ0438378.1 hypothetical protein [Kaistia dalseonensis]